MTLKPIPAAAGFIIAPAVTSLVSSGPVPAIGWQPGQPKPYVLQVAERRNAVTATIAFGGVALASLLAGRYVLKNPAHVSAANGAALGSALAAVVSLATLPSAPVDRPSVPPPPATTTTTSTTTTTPPVEYDAIPIEGAFAYQAPSENAPTVPISPRVDPMMGRQPIRVAVLERRGEWTHVRPVTVEGRPAVAPWPTFWVRSSALQSAAAMQPTPDPMAPTATPVANMIGCTPLSSSIPQSAINQADALLRLKPKSANPNEVATAVSVTAMRRLADAIAYCGGPDEWTLRDGYAKGLRAHADLLEPTLPAF